MTQKITHKYLLKCKGKRCKGNLFGVKIEDALIQVEANRVYICQNLQDGLKCRDKLGYLYSWELSQPKNKFEDKDIGCYNIEIIEEDIQQELDKALDDIDPNKIERPTHYQLNIDGNVIDVNKILQAIAFKLDGKVDLMLWAYFTNLIEYSIRSWFKGQQLNDLKKAKTEIEFMINKLEGK